MVTRSLSLLVAFFMMSAVGGTAQIQSSGSGPSGGSSAGKIISLPVSSIDLKQPSVAKKSGKALPATRSNANGIVIKIGTNEYADWESAIAALEEGDEMVLQQSLELDATRATLPTVACTISGNTGKEVLGYKEAGERKTLLMKAPLTFKNIILDIDDIMASGYPLVLDEGTDISEFMKSDEASFRIWGGAYDRDVASTSITIKAGTYDYIYGGSAKYKVTGKTTVDVQGGTVNWIFGGGMSAGSTVDQTDVTISGGTINYNVFAGGSSGDVEKDTRLTVMDKASILFSYGGGYSGKVGGTCCTIVEGGAIDYLFGGGQEQLATCGNTEVIVNGGTIGRVEQGLRFNLMGGGYKAPVTGKAKVTLNGGQFDCFVTAGGGQNDITTATCGSTELIITGGTLSQWTYGGGWASPVLGTATVRVSGTPTFRETLFGGGLRSTASCGNTDMEVSEGTLGYLYGGGELGPVIGESKLVITGSASASWTFGGCFEADCGSTNVTLNTTGTIAGSLYGGCRTGSCGTTQVNIKQGTVTNNIYGGGEQEGSLITGDTHVAVDGGSCIGVFGGGWEGQVKGTTHVVVNGGTMSNAIYGGGYGDDQVFNDKGSVGNTEVLVKNALAEPNVFGGGLHGNVTGNTSVTIEGGSFSSVYGSSYIERDNQTLVGGNVNILIKGGEMEHVSMARGQLKDEAVPVSGSMNLTIEGGKVTQQITSGNHPDGEGYKPCTLTIRNLGNEFKPYSLPNVRGISNLVLDGSVVDALPDPANVFPGYMVDENNPLTITGNGKLVGTNILLSNFNDLGATFFVDVPLIIADALPRTTTFSAYEKMEHDAIKTFPVYKAGNTYRMTKTPDDLKTIAITSPVNGTFSVTWKETTRDTELESGDQVPLNTELTLSAIPDEGYRFIEYQNNEVKITDNPYQITTDAAFSALFEAIPYQVTITSVPNGSITASPNTDVTIGTEIALTITPASGYRLKSGSLKVYKTGDESTTVNVTNNTFSMPAYDVTVAAEFEEIPAPPTPPAPVYHTVTLPAVEGASTDPIAGDHEVESWDNFLFFLTLDKAYDQSKPVVTTDRGETITPRAKDGAYIIKYVRQPIVIMIDGVVKNPDPTANAEIQSRIKVWQNNHQLFIHTDKIEQVAIYTFGGQLKKKFRSTGGDELVQLPTGSYIVCIGDQRFKVVL